MINVETYHPNPEGRLMFVGDIHGELDTLEIMLEKIGFEVGVDTLISVGDLIDRGPRSYDTVKMFTSSTPGLKAVIGNHDDFAINACNGGSIMGWMQNGGQWVLPLGDGVVGDMGQRLKRLPRLLDVHFKDIRIGVAHAQVPGRCDWVDFITQAALGTMDRGEEVDITWGREVKTWSKGASYEPPNVLGVDIVIHGHNIMEVPISIGNRIYIDTGVFLPEGSLTVMEVFPDPDSPDNCSANFYRHDRVRNAC